MKKRKSNDSVALSVDSARTSTSSDTHEVFHSAAGSATAATQSDDSMQDIAGEELDVMGTPIALAPATTQRLLNFTPATPDASSASAGEDSTFRRLNFTTKECATPGRYDARHKLGQPLAVYCRIKPLLTGVSSAMIGEHDDSSSSLSSSESKTPESVMTIDSETSITCTAPKDSATFRHGETSSKFTFTRVFGPETSQEEVFTHAAQPLVKSFYEGQNGLIFAYGITASGKTYTMQGTKAQPGLIPRIVADLFGRVLSDAEDNKPKFKVVCSFLEIYNETINDLLIDPKAAKLKKSAACKLQTSKTDEVSVVNLREVSINDHREAFSLLNQGQSNRTQHETLLNSDSSRSHSVFTLKLVHASNGQVWSRLSVVDLAGSERTNRVVHSGKESRMRETVNINQSLLVLGRCLEALKYNQNQPRKPKVVPFRESQITRLFKDSLSGWGRTVMLTNASQTEVDYDETIHALKYAAVAKEIRVLPKVDSIRPTGTSRMHSGLKRQPSQPLQELDELEHAGGTATNGPSSSGWDQDDSNNPSYDSLLDECFRLKSQIVSLEFQASNTELAVREELTQQHEELLNEMEEQFSDRLDAERTKQDEKNKKMLELWKMEWISMNQGQIGGTSSASNFTPSATEELTSLRFQLMQSQAQITSLQSSIASNDVLLDSTKEMYKESQTSNQTLTKRMKQLEKDLASKSSELERTQALVQEAQEQLKQREDGVEVEWQEKIQAVQVKANQDMEQLKEQLNEAHQNELASTVQQHKDELAALKKSHKDEINALTKQHKEDIATNNKNHKEEIATLMNQHKEEIATQTKLHKDEMASESNMRNLEMGAILATHRQDLTSLKNTHKAEIATLQQQYQTDLAAVRGSESEQVTELNTKLAEAEGKIGSMEAKLAESVTESKEMKAQLKVAQKEIDQATKGVKKEKDQELKEIKKAAKDELKQLTQEKDAAFDEMQTTLQDQITSLEGQVASLTASIASSQQTISQNEADVAATKSKDQELKESKKIAKDELKQAIQEKDVAFAKMQTQLQHQIASLEGQVATLTAAAIAASQQMISSTPASDPLSDTWGDLLSPIKPAPSTAAAAAGRVKRATTKVTAPVAGTKRAAAPSAATSKPKASSKQQQVDDTFDPFAFDASEVVAGPNNSVFMADDDEGEYQEMVKLQQKLSNDKEADDDEYQPTKKRKTTTTATRTAVGAKKITAPSIADKENASAPANTGRAVRSKRTVAAK